VTAGGENVAPYPIENRILSELGAFCSWAVIIGDNRKFLSLLLTIRNKNYPTVVPINEIELDS